VYLGIDTRECERTLSAARIDAQQQGFIRHR
jgi:hypothetical protein